MSKVYTVDDITERTSISRQGKVEKLYRVTARSKSGFTFTVEIPEADFGQKEKVDKILADKASHLEDIKQL